MTFSYLPLLAYQGKSLLFIQRIARGKYGDSTKVTRTVSNILNNTPA